MGHNLIPTPANTIPWNAVVECVYGGARLEDIVAATANLAEKQMRGASKDPNHLEAVTLLLKLPLAAREASFLAAARDLGLELGDRPDVAEIVFAVSDHLDRRAGELGRADDFSELSGRALVGALTEALTDETAGFFEAEPEDVVAALKRVSEPRRFTGLARSYYTRLFSETLSSLLDRVLASHVGPGQRFAHAGDRAAFDQAMATYAQETTRIIHEFAAGWYAKHAYGDEGLTPPKIAGFAHVALKKTLDELRRKEERDA